MVRPGRERLTGLVDDETYWGAEEEGVIGRQTERKALIAVAAEERGTGLGRIRHAARSERLGGQFDALRRGVGRAGQRGCYRQLVGLRSAQGRTTSVVSSRLTTAASRPRSYCRGCTWRSRYSSAGCWARIRGRSATSIWTVSTSSCSASIGADHAVGASSSTALCSRPWRWSRRRTASSPIGTLRRCEPNYKMLGSPESSGYPASTSVENKAM